MPGPAPASAAVPPALAAAERPKSTGGIAKSQRLPVNSGHQALDHATRTQMARTISGSPAPARPGGVSLQK